MSKILQCVCLLTRQAMVLWRNAKRPIIFHVFIIINVCTFCWTFGLLYNNNNNNNNNNNKT